jgi:hypothetical protein
LSRDGFLRRGETRADVSDDGKVPVERDKFTISQMTGAMVVEMDLSRVAGTGSRSQ